MKNSIETYTVDSFTNQTFKGNPAGVCLLATILSEEQMLLIAQELGFSETAFVSTTELSDHYRIRFFSPKMEIPLCGHATLAASKVLFIKFPELQRIVFENIQKLKLSIESSGDKIAMVFPVYQTHPATTPKKLLSALGIAQIKNSVFNKETNILLLEIEDAKTLKNLAPDYSKLLRAHDHINGVLVTATSSKSEYDFESRYFWPWSGTNEDPVTGGTHTFLAKYWGDRLGKTKMNAFQCSKRSGFMEVELIDSKQLIIKSEAQIVMKGEFYL